MRLVGVLLLVGAACAGEGPCGGVYEGTWVALPPEPGGCDPAVRDPQPENCAQIAWDGDGCWLSTRSICSGGVERIFHANPETRSGWLVLRDEPRDCSTRYPVRWQP